MPDVEIYYWSTCPYSNKAKSLLSEKGVQYRGYNITDDEPAREKMMERTRGKRTVPQIFINGSHIGGCDDLHTLDAQGKLDQLLMA